MNVYKLLPLLLWMILVFSACKTSTEPEVDADSIFPMYLDENANNVNDFVEQGSHEAGQQKTISSANTSSVPGGGPGHSFVDENNDGICDYAQDGSLTWHGPGFVDMNRNGMIDHWENGGRGHGGMMGRGHN